MYRNGEQVMSKSGARIKEEKNKDKKKKNKAKGEQG